MSAVEVADIFRDSGANWRRQNAGHISLRQLKAMSAIERCRTAALGGHLYCCEECGYEHPRYNSCGNRHCPACQAGARERWLAEQEKDLLELPYFHLVFTLPSELRPLILRNKTVGYNLLFKCAADTLLKFGRDPAHQLCGQLGFTAVLHTWNQRLLPHIHLHVLVPATMGALPPPPRGIFGQMKDVGGAP